jgi:fructose-bisphosphate aldolase, class II
MALVSITQLMKKADTEQYAVGAFNANNMEIVQAIIEAAEEAKSPVILQASQGAIKYAGIDFISGMVKIAAERATVPVALHLDHGNSFEQNMLCIRHGFSSVMYDGSALPLEENIRMTKRVIEVAHAVGVSVEGELGKIGGTEDDISVDEKDARYTVPKEARHFVEQTNIDLLAIAIGTAHGPYKGGSPKLDLDRLVEIKALIPNTPVVLHGASGVSDESIRECIARGVRKINIDTDLRQAFVWKMRDIMAANPKEIDPRKILGPAKDALKEVVKAKMRLFGCAGRV